MKQNEKILVYAVTGFLAVILGVAILFGKDSTRRLPDVRTDVAETPSLEALLDRRAAENKAVDASASGGTQTEQPKVENPAQPLVANVQLAPPTPAALVTEKLGLSRQENGYRIVRAARGDTLGALVRKWCGSLDLLADAQGLNETMQTLQVGQTVVLPWVEDDVILAAYDRRTAAAAPQPTPAFAPAPSPTSTVVPADASATKTGAVTQPEGSAAVAGVPAATPAPGATQTGARTYKITAKDSLWKIAEREVGKAKAYAYVEKILDANPNLDAERLRLGQTNTLPAKD
jgi:nucleoid-associated protein YgaU